jgi:hypothetical protein
LAIEAFLWLPCDVAQKMMDILSHDPNAVTTRDLIAEVRQLLNADGVLPASQVVLFDPITP